METTTKLKTFNYQEDGSISFSLLETIETTKTLKRGVYNIYTEYIGGQGYVTSISMLLNQETYNINVPFYFKDKIDHIFEMFFNTDVKRRIKSLGYKHKLGVLLYGKQGTGKTSLIRNYFNNTVSCCDAIVFNITKVDYFNRTWDFIKDIRKIQDNPIVVFIDECDSFFPNQENEVKKALDGIDSIDNCIVLMATNYIDKIPDTIKNRPSRLKYIIEVEGIQEEFIIEDFLKESFNKIEVDFDYKKDLVKLKGSTLDELKEYVLNVIMNIEEESKKPKKLGF